MIGDWNFESSVIGLSILLYNDHIISTSVRNRIGGLKVLLWSLKIYSILKGLVVDFSVTELT